MAPCPACGLEIHPLAGRCKHCRVDLLQLRADAQRASARVAVVTEPGAHTEVSPAARPTRAPTVLLAALVFLASVGLGLAAERLRRAGPPPAARTSAVR